MAAEDVCRRAGLAIEWAKLSAASLQEAASRSGVRFGASQDGGYIFPDFLPGYDAAAAFVNLLDMLAATGVSLSKLAAELPRPYVAHQTVATPWEQKGMLMRTAVETLKDRELVLVDGVKVVHDDGWALILPDPDEPLTHVWAEGPDDSGARGRVAEYAGLAQRLLD
jgi:mannose-1-phosphate guanylyltransferase/phosphomannomutase